MPVGLRASLVSHLSPRQEARELTLLMTIYKRGEHACDVVQQHDGRFLPQDKAALAARILSRYGRQLSVANASLSPLQAYAQKCPRPSGARPIASILNRIEPVTCHLHSQDSVSQIYPWVRQGLTSRRLSRQSSTTEFARPQLSPNSLWVAH